METTETICPFILVKPTSYRESSGMAYPNNIMVNTNQGPMLAAKIELFRGEDGGCGYRTVLLTLKDIEEEVTDVPA